MKMRVAGMCGLVMIIIVAGMVCSKATSESNKKAESSSVLHVKVERVLRDSIVLPLLFSGKLTTAAEVRLGFKTGGIVRQILVQEGAIVNKGALLATLDTVEFSAWNEKAVSALEKAARDRSRVRQLYSDSVATHEQLQNAESAYRAALADVEITKFNTAQSMLRAPGAGRVLKRLAERGEVVGPGMPVVILASTDGAWQVTASVPDVDLSLLQTGDRAEVLFDAVPGKQFHARLSKIAPSAHPVTGTFEITVDLDTSDALLRHGMFTEVKVYPSLQSSLCFIPASALALADGKRGVVVTPSENGTPQQVAISIERMFGDLVAVSGGLDSVQYVVTHGAAYVLTTNDKVVFDR